LHIWMRVQYLEKEDNSTRTDRGIRSGIRLEGGGTNVVFRRNQII
jgi:hypothetical protein